jgi:hypothetical protein
VLPTPPRPRCARFNFAPLPRSRPPTLLALVWADQRALRAVLTLWTVAMVIGSLMMALSF